VALKWLHNSRCPWDSATCDAAARGGHLEMLKRLHRSGCPWSVRTCICIAVGGHLRVLKWAREHHCPWNEDTIRGHAVQGGNMEMLRWLDEQGIP
jgi:hypothetical protein